MECCLAYEPAAIRLTSDRKEPAATGEDLCCILVKALDEKGAFCSLTDNLICFDVEGLAKIKPVGNGNPFRSKYFRQKAGGANFN